MTNFLSRNRPIMKIIRQRKIDEGQVGGFLSIFTQSMFIFGIVNFLGISALVYQSILKSYIPLWIFFIVMGIGYFIWMMIYYSVIMPSMIQFSNRQGYAHGNPVREDMILLRNELIEIRKEHRETKEKLEYIRGDLEDIREKLEEMDIEAR